MKKIIAAGISTILAACAAHSTLQRDELLDNSRSLSENIMYMLAQSDYKSHACNDPRLLTSQRSVDSLEHTGYLLYQASIDTGRSRVERISRSEQLDEVVPLALRPKLRLAEVYTTIGCFDEAKQVYDGVLQTYSGTQYAGYRDRALAGLNEITILSHKN